MAGGETAMQREGGHVVPGALQGGRTMNQADVQLGCWWFILCACLWDIHFCVSQIWICGRLSVLAWPPPKPNSVNVSICCGQLDLCAHTHTNTHRHGLKWNKARDERGCDTVLQRQGSRHITGDRSARVMKWMRGEVWRSLLWLDW